MCQPQKTLNIHWHCFKTCSNWTFLSHFQHRLSNWTTHTALLLMMMQPTQIQIRATRVLAVFDTFTLWVHQHSVCFCLSHQQQQRRTSHGICLSGLVLRLVWSLSSLSQKWTPFELVGIVHSHAAVRPVSSKTTTGKYNRWRLSLYTPEKWLHNPGPPLQHLTLPRWKIHFFHKMQHVDRKYYFQDRLTSEK